MNRIHTAILALVMSIFLIQAIDPPFEKPTGSFLQFYPLRNIQSGSQELISKSIPGAVESLAKKIEVLDRQDNFPYSLNTELKPPPLIETDLKPPPPPLGALLNFVPDSIAQQSEKKTVVKKNKKIAGSFRYLNILELDPPSLPIENSENNENPDSLYPPLNIENYLNKLTPEQIQVLNPKIPDDIPSDFNEQTIKFQQHFNTEDTLSRLRDYLAKIRSEYDNSNSLSSENSYTVAKFNSSTNDKILGKDFIKPLLKLYENEIHHQPDYATANGTSDSNGNFEDIDEEIRTFTQNELHILINGTEHKTGANGQDLNLYNEALIVGNSDSNELQDHRFLANNVDQNHIANEQSSNEFTDQRVITETKPNLNNQQYFVQKLENHNHIANEDFSKRKDTSETIKNDNSKNRRDDTSLISVNDKEHIGEILPPLFNKDSSSSNQQISPQVLQASYGRKNYRMRKSFESAPQTGVRRIPFSFPGERFRPEYEPSGSSGEGTDLAEYQRLNLAGSEPLYPRAPRLGLPPTEVSGFRLPRRYRGFRETYSDGGFQPYFDNSARYQTAWSVRKPRVIFPTDLVAFRDSEQNGNKDPEPDWLSGDNQLQDIQESDTRDRGEFFKSIAW